MLNELILKRFSTRAFSEKSIEDEKIKFLFEAAKWAPSSRNEQPWNFIFVTKNEPEDFEKMTEILTGSNKIWASKAPLLILTIANTISSKGNLNKYAIHDVALAVANLTFQANYMDLQVHQMAGFNPDLAKEFFEIPEGFEPVTVLAIGYLGNVDGLSEDMKLRENSPRKRKDISEFVFNKKFGNNFYNKI